jgi:lysophospholipase L1-like esterase
MTMSRKSNALFTWALLLAFGAATVVLALIEGKVFGAKEELANRRAIAQASLLPVPALLGSTSGTRVDGGVQVSRSSATVAAGAALGDLATNALAEAVRGDALNLLRAATSPLPTPNPVGPDPTAVAALTEVALPSVSPDEGPLSYAKPTVGWPAKYSRRLTILQLGDSHTAADFFTGRVRERLQQVFGAGGEAYVVPGRPHLGVRSALFESGASDGWTYEALQRSDETRRFYLSGFNAVARHAGATLSLRARSDALYDQLKISFLRQPGGGRAEVLIDGAKSGEIELDGAADQRAILDLRAPETASAGFHEVSVRALSDAPVTVTGFEVGRDGDGVSYVSLGFPGATVQLLQRLASENLADDLRRIDPEVVVLAFGTNEGFNDNLDVGAYAAQYERIVRSLRDLAPGLRIVIIGPPDGARPPSGCHNSGAGHDCVAAQPLLASVDGGQCRFPTPTKLAAVREAQRRLAARVGAEFWDWSSVMPGPCGAQVWRAADPQLMANDYVHMTQEGYKRSADRFADFLIPLIEGWQMKTNVVSNN